MRLVRLLSVAAAAVEAPMRRGLHGSAVAVAAPAATRPQRPVVPAAALLLLLPLLLLSIGTFVHASDVVGSAAQRASGGGASDESEETQQSVMQECVAGLIRDLVDITSSSCGSRCAFSGCAESTKSDPYHTLGRGARLEHADCAV
eukprot:356690-Chlamydomonas_euryale.AAC.13